METARITGLHHYPIKSCAAVPLTEAVLTPAGLQHDRTFMVTGPDGTCRTQRRDPRLALIHPEISTDGERLVLRGPDTDDARVDVDLTGPRRSVTMFGKTWTGIDQGDDAAAWITDVLRAPSRLVRVPPEHRRVTGGLTPGTSAYADSSALHLISIASVDHLNDRIVARGDRPVSIDRFRPNVVIDGWSEPHREDLIRQVCIGDAEIGYAKLAVRCVTTTVRQESGTKSGPEPLRTLADYRRTRAGGVAIGAKFAVVRAGKLSIGDELTVDYWGLSEL